MVASQSLLDFLAFQMGCNYLSDLRFLSGVQQKILIKKLELLQPCEEDVQEWNDLLEYLVGIPSQSTAAKAKQALLKTLEQTSMS
ncbi:MAG: hypothetical protein ACOX60_02705 [Massiliimalia sp.]